MPGHTNIRFNEDGEMLLSNTNYVFKNNSDQSSVLKGHDTNVNVNYVFKNILIIKLTRRTNFSNLFLD